MQLPMYSHKKSCWSEEEESARTGKSVRSLERAATQKRGIRCSLGTNLLEYFMCCIKMKVLTALIYSLTEEKGKLMQENKQLSESLADETKIKIS